MKKIILSICLSSILFSCNKQEEKPKTEEIKEMPVKTAYVNTAELMKKYNKAIALEAKYKSASEKKGKQLEAKINQFKKDASSFQSQAQLKGQEWAQQRAAELQKREQQLAYEQQNAAQELQSKGAVEMDSLVSGVKRFIKDYGKKNDYTYIYGTGEVASILYAKEKLDITNELIKLLNEEKPAAKE
jgi:outer membrane protein